MIMPMDKSTLKPGKLPGALIVDNCHVENHFGAGCFLDAPGFPSYFLRYVYTPGGDKPRKGSTQIIAVRGNLYEVENINTPYNAERKDALLMSLWGKTNV